MHPVDHAGEIPADYSWAVSEPFRVTPQSGTLEGGATATFQFTCLPKAAELLSSTAVISFRNAAPAETLSLSGAYCFLLLGCGRSVSPCVVSRRPACVHGRRPYRLTRCHRLYQRRRSMRS